MNSPRSGAGVAVKQAPTAATRYLAADAWRGMIMIIMAVDHASGFIARQHGAEFWSGAMSAYDSAFPFLTRWITHLCAPGFFFLMGAGIYWGAATRRDAGLSGGTVMRRTMLRGAVLFLLAQLLEMPAVFAQGLLKSPAVSLGRISAPPPTDGSAPFWFLVTMTALGLVMVACGLLLRLRPWAWLLVSALCVVATHALLPADGQPGPWWAAVLLTAGISQHLLVVYPVIPWLAVSAAGMYFGYWWRGNPERAGRRVWIPGAALLVTGILVRATGGWGNIRPPRDGGWIEFLNNVKYPPSLVYWTMSVGIGLLLLAVLVRLPAKWKPERSPLIVFGQTPLFFYFAHFYLLLVLAYAAFREPGSLETAWLMWAVVLVLLYPACAWFRRFKLSKPRESYWRMF